MTVIRDIRLQNGMGCINRKNLRVLAPPDESVFQLAHSPGDAEADLQRFYIVDAGAVQVAILPPDSGDSAVGERASMARALGSLCPVVVAVEAEATGAAVATCYSLAERALDSAACGLWGLKAMGGWDESEVMTFRITHVAHVAAAGEDALPAVDRAAWISATRRLGDGPRAVQLERSDRDGWRALHERMASLGADCGFFAIDVDWTLAYNDAYGFVAGDLMLARVDAALRQVARADEAAFARVSGDKFVMALDEPNRDRASLLAEAARAAVTSLAIPFRHPRIATHPVVTASVGVCKASILSAPHVEDLRDQLLHALQQAKLRGRNCIELNE